MATIANSFFDTNNVAVKELIGDRSTELMVVSEPMFANMIINDAGIEGANTELGRDLLIKSTYYGSLAGVIRGGNQSQFVNLYGDQTQSLGPRMYSNQINQAFPNPMNGPNPKPFGMTSKLYSVEVNLALSLTMLNMEALPANIKEHLNPIIKGLANNINLWACNSVYLNSESQYRLATMGASSGWTYDTTNKTITFTPTEKCTHRFAVGQSVDIFKDTTTLANKSDTTASRVRLFVGVVDDWENTVTLQADPSGKAEDGTTATFGNGTTTGWAGTTNMSTAAFIVQANTYSAGFAGMYNLRDWFKWGNAASAAAVKRLLGSNAITTTTNDYIDVTQHSEFKSGHFGAVGALNERKLLGMLAGVNRAFVRHGHTIDTVIAADGIFLNIFDQLLARETIQRGNPMTPGAITGMGFSGGFQIVYDGGSVTGETSRFVESGVMYGVKRHGNWRLVVPPDGAGLSQGTLPGKKPTIPLTFVGKALGNASDRMPLQVLRDGIVVPTEFCHMPGYIRMQFMPKQGGQIPGVVWEGVKETRTYGAP